MSGCGTAPQYRKPKNDGKWAKTALKLKIQK